jgi:hypothetical protein
MTDEQQGQKPDRPEPEYAPGLPVAFADMVASCSHSSELAKFYLARIDASANAVGARRTEYVAQVVMPLSGFIESVDFLNDMLRQIGDTGNITDDTRALIRRVVGDTPIRGSGSV